MAGADGEAGAWRSATRVAFSRVWLRAPLGLLALPRLLALVMLMFGVATAALAAQPQFVDAARTKTVRDVLADGCRQGAGLQIDAPVGLKGVTVPDGVSFGGPAVDRLVANEAVAGRLAGVRGLDPEVRTLRATAEVSASGVTSPTGLALMARTGAAGHVDLVAGRPGDLLLPDTVARRLAIGAGDTVEVSVNGVPTTLLVSGVFRDLSRVERDRWWCSVEGSFVAVRDTNSPPPVALLTEDQLLAVLANGRQPVVSSLWEYAPHAGISGRSAASLAARLAGTAEDVRNRASNLGATLVLGRSDAPLVDIVRVASQTGTAVGSLTGSLAVAVVVIVLLVVWSAGGVWAERRWTELVNLAVRGVPPWLLGVRAVLEVAPAVLVAGAAGTVVSWAVIADLGPGVPADGATRFAAARLALLLAAVAVLVVAVAVWSRVRRLGTDPGLLEPTRPRAAPWEVPALVLAVAALVELRGRPTLIVLAEEDTRVDLLVLLLPVALLAGLGGLVGRIAVAAIGRRRRLGPGRWPVPLWLALRRLSAAGPRAVAVFAGAAVSLGMVVFATTLTRSLTTTLHAKSTVRVGAAQAVTVLAPRPLPLGPSWAGQATTVVRTTERALPALGRPPATVLGVDAGSFERGAAWDPSYAGASLDSLLRRLGTEGPGSPIPALATATVPEDAVVTVRGAGGDVALRVQVVARVRAFPGQRDAAAIVVDRRALLAAGVEEVAEVWTRSRSAAVLSDLAASGAEPTSAIVEDTARFQPLLLAQLWSIRYLRLASLAVVTGTLCALLLRLADDDERRVRSARLLARLGLSRAGAWLATAIELGLVLLGGAAVGGGVAAVVARILAPRLDPIPTGPPPFILRFDRPLLVGALGVALVIAAMLALAATWWDSRRSPGSPAWPS